MSAVENGQPPRRIVDSFDAVCSHCGQAMYSEAIEASLQSDGNYAYRRVVSGCFFQTCDPDGTPTGPVIPTCTCKGG